ncbi:DUF4349 domain-containing protein (plasmid) [Coraliomargarita sp. W4R53]
MNEQHESADLPHLSDERVAEMERSVFASISEERVAHKRARRGKWWLSGAAAAAVIVVAAVIAPSIGGLVGGASYSSADAPVVVLDGAEMAPEEFSGADSEADTSVMGARQELGGVTSERAIITNASATVVVDDVTESSKTIAEAALSRDGYVESMSIGRSGGVYPIEEYGDGVAQDTMPYPYTPDGAWITVRLPSDELDAMVRELSTLGEVTSSSINRQDVTDQTVDLTARIESAEASVDRLIDLMTEATSVADLLAAESALSERQAMLESYQQQLESIEGQVAMSSLTVTLTPKTEPVEADPAGFTDGVIAGWNGLVATMNGIVIALGFMLPWLAAMAIAASIVWSVVRVVRTKRRAKLAAGSLATTQEDHADSTQ